MVDCFDCFRIANDPLVAFPVWPGSRVAGVTLWPKSLERILESGITGPGKWTFLMFYRLKVKAWFNASSRSLYIVVV